MDKNTASSVEFEGDKYILCDAEITVNTVICAYQDTIYSQVQKIENNKLKYSGGCKLFTHNPDAYGVCAYCGTTDLAKAYANGHLHVEGLTGRTYDSYPQIFAGWYNKGACKAKLLQFKGGYAVEQPYRRRW